MDLITRILMAAGGLTLFWLIFFVGEYYSGEHALKAARTASLIVVAIVAFFGAIGLFTTAALGFGPW